MKEILWDKQPAGGLCRYTGAASLSREIHKMVTNIA